MARLKKAFCAFYRNERGGLPSLEFALISPIMIIFVFCVIQFMLMAHAQIVMRQAAYAAARSALVNDCPPISFESSMGNLFGAASSLLWNKCTPDKEKWETAARIALMPISASDTKSEARQSGCKYPKALTQILSGDPVRKELDPTLHNKACYAFEPDNVRVEIEWQTLINGVQVKAGPPPVKATVKFKFPILAPTRMIFSNGSRGDGTKYWQGQAEVTLL